MTPTTSTPSELGAAHGSVYPAQDSESLGEHYIRHVCAMTSESLHAKSDIARQLAARDKMLAVLWAEYEDRRAQWGDEYLWTKHEDAEAIEEVKVFITQTQNAFDVATKPAPVGSEKHE